MSKERFFLLKLWPEVVAVALLALFAGSTPCSAQNAGNKELPVVWVLSHWWHDCWLGAFHRRTSPITRAARFSARTSLTPFLKSSNLLIVKVEQVVNVASQDIRRSIPG